MSAIFHESTLPSFMPAAPILSFYEMRVAEQQLVNPCFMQLGAGWWGYDIPSARLEVLRPSWDPSYDWSAAYDAARLSLARKPSVWWQ